MNDNYWENKAVVDGADHLRQCNPPDNNIETVLCDNCGDEYTAYDLKYCSECEKNLCKVCFGSGEICQKCIKKEEQNGKSL